jgi:hypothetical protein
MKADVQSATLVSTEAQQAKLRLLASDLRAVGRIQEMGFEIGEEIELKDFTLAEEN